MGRSPIAQPPGNETRASPNLANKGPSTRQEARIVETRSYGASGLSALEVSKIIFSLW